MGNITPNEFCAHVPTQALPCMDVHHAWARQQCVSNYFEENSSTSKAMMIKRSDFFWPVKHSEWLACLKMYYLLLASLLRLADGSVATADNIVDACGLMCSSNVACKIQPPAGFCMHSEYHSYASKTVIPIQASTKSMMHLLMLQGPCRGVTRACSRGPW